LIEFNSGAPDVAGHYRKYQYVWRIGTLQVLANHQVRPFVWVAKVSIEFIFGADHISRYRDVR